MKYETPELTALTPAIDAIQVTGSTKGLHVIDSPQSQNDASSAYADWEE
jgi:hypothetical protein